jgi:putative transcriptional regulator
MEKRMTNRLKVLRAGCNMTQEALAEKVGVTRQTIIAIEKNKYLPSLDLALRLARVFEARVEDIFIYNDNAI